MDFCSAAKAILLCAALLQLSFSCGPNVAAAGDESLAVDDDEFVGGARPGTGQGTTVKKALGSESPLEVTALPAARDPMDDLLSGGLLPESSGAGGGSREEPQDIGSVLPPSDTLFNKDAVDPQAFNDIDCHLRNLDLCYAGMLSATMKILPETDAELEARCDEMKAMMGCIAVYNQRCANIKIFSMMMPMAQVRQAKSTLPKNLLDARLPTELLDQGRAARNSTELKFLDLLELCEPSAKNTAANKELRRRLFELAKCMAPRLKLLRPCIEDLKNAFQLFYEPQRFLPFEPACCAISQFRHCAQESLSGVCGISSFGQLEAALTEGPQGQMLSSIQRACRRRASSYDTDYCKEVLPARGVKVPPRRGRKASKLARVLDKFSFVPN